MACIEDNFLTQVTERPAREVLLVLLLTSSEELKGEVKTGGSCSDRALVEIMISRGISQVKSID